MITIEKIIKLLAADRELAWSLKKYHAANGEMALSERYLGEWLGLDLALTMLTDEAQAEVLFKTRFAKEAPNVDVP